jgi:ankyrin repeat protein
MQQGGDTALMLASEKGRTATVLALIGAGADLNLQGTVSVEKRSGQLCVTMLCPDGTV